MHKNTEGTSREAKYEYSAVLRPQLEVMEMLLATYFAHS